MTVTACPPDSASTGHTRRLPIAAPFTQEPMLPDAARDALAHGAPGREAGDA